MERDALRTTVAAITTAEANVGSAVPENMRRFIYRVKVNNQYAGANLLTLGKRENGAGATTTVDYFQTSVQYETDTDPDELKEDAAPLYIIEGGGDTGDSYLRAVTDNGNAYLTIWYIDAPA
jgi:hypothetical protein